MTTNLLTWNMVEDSGDRIAYHEGRAFLIVKVSGGYFRLMVDGAWEGTRTSLTKALVLAEQLAQGSPVSPLNDPAPFPALVQLAAESRKSKPKTSKPKSETPAQEPVMSPAKVTKSSKGKKVEAPTITPASDVELMGQIADADLASRSKVEPAQPPVVTQPVVSQEPRNLGCELCNLRAHQNPELSDEQIKSECQACQMVRDDAAKAKKSAEPVLVVQAPEGVEEVQGNGVSSGSPDERQPEPRSSKGLRKVVALAGKCPIPLPENVANRASLLEWCESLRDHCEDQGQFLTVSGLCHAARSLAKTPAEGESIALAIKSIYDREVKAVAAAAQKSQEPAAKPAKSGSKIVSQTDGAVTKPSAPKPAAKVLSSNENATVTQGDAGGKRYMLFGFPVTSVLRWMGKNGWKFADARKALDKLGIPCADGTLVAQLRAGVTGQRGDPATITGPQAAELDQARA